MIWVRVFDEDPPDRLMEPTRSRRRGRPAAAAARRPAGRAARPATGREAAPDRRRVASRRCRQATDDDAFAERPELFVGAAFAGGLALAAAPEVAGKPGRMTSARAKRRQDARRDRRGGLREGLAARPRGDRARQGRGHREGQDARQGRRRRRRRRRVPLLRRRHVPARASPGSSTTCSTANTIWPGFGIDTLLLVVLAAIAGLLAYRLLQEGRAADAGHGDRGGQAHPRAARAPDDRARPARADRSRRARRSSADGTCPPRSPEQIRARSRRPRGAGLLGQRPALEGRRAHQLAPPARREPPARPSSARRWPAS